MKATVDQFNTRCPLRRETFMPNDVLVYVVSTDVVHSSVDASQHLLLDLIHQKCVVKEGQ